MYTFQPFYNNNADDKGFDTVCAKPTRYQQLTASLFDRLYDHCLRNRNLKSYLKFLQRASTGFGFQVQQGVITATLAIDGLKGLAIGHYILTMSYNPVS